MHKNQDEDSSVFFSPFLMMEIKTKTFSLLLSLSYDGPEWKERDSTLDRRGGLVLKKTSTKMEPKQKETCKIWCNRVLIQIGSLSAAGLSSTKLQKRATTTL
jgi:hypothetical protein